MARWKSSSCARRSGRDASARSDGIRIGRRAPAGKQTRISAMTYRTLLVERSNGVALVSLNRPDKKNAMNPQLHEDMTALLEELRYDDAMRVIVFTGAGDAFCAGMDLKEVFHALKDKPAQYDRVIR